MAWFGAIGIAEVYRVLESGELARTLRRACARTEAKHSTSGRELAVTRGLNLRVRSRLTVSSRLVDARSSTITLVEIL
eukprot:661793-Pleurochrysis_carterae.AAC.1